MTFSMSPSSKKCSNASSCNVRPPHRRNERTYATSVRSRGAGAEVRVSGGYAEPEGRGVRVLSRTEIAAMPHPSFRAFVEPGVVCAARPARIGGGSGGGKRCQTRRLRSRSWPSHGRSWRAPDVANRSRNGWVDVQAAASGEPSMRFGAPARVAFARGARRRS